MKHASLPNLLLAVIVAAGFTYAFTKKYTWEWSCCKKNQTSCCSQSKEEIVVINVLDKQYFDDCHIKGSINIPLNELEANIESLDKNKTYVVYCANSMCHASGEAANILKKCGFNNVYEYSGGAAEWYQLAQENPEFECEGPCESSYLKTVIPQEAAQNLAEEASKDNSCSNRTPCNTKNHHSITCVSAGELSQMLKK